MEHTELLKNLATECDKIGVILYEHSYHHQIFGSWSLTVGNPHHRMRFTWDGKESYLGIGEAELRNSNSVPNWKYISPSISGTQTKPKEVFEFITKMVSLRYST